MADVASDDIDNLRAAIDWQVLHEPDDAARTVFERWNDFAPARLLLLQHWLEALVDRIDPADDALVARLLERLGDACFQTGVHIEDAIAWLDRALAIREKRGETIRVARVHVRLARNLSGYPQFMDIERALDNASRAEAILREAGNERLLAEVHIMQASTALYGRHNRDGVKAARSAMVLAERQGLEPIRLHALAELGVHLGYCGEVEQGFTLLEHAWECADLARDHFAQFVAACDARLRRALALGSGRRARVVGARAGAGRGGRGALAGPHARLDARARVLAHRRRARRAPRSPPTTCSTRHSSCPSPRL